MKKAAVFFLLFPLIALFNLMPVLLQAPRARERISGTERGDQKGLVVRHHLTAKVDSFKVGQPSEQLVQVMIYSRNLRTSGFVRPDLKPGLSRIEYHQTEDGFGMDIFLSEGSYFKTSIYYDQNRDRKSTRLNSSHVAISYAVFCFKKTNNN